MSRILNATIRVERGTRESGVACLMQVTASVPAFCLLTNSESRKFGRDSLPSQAVRASVRFLGPRVKREHAFQSARCWIQNRRTRRHYLIKEFVVLMLGRT